MISFLVLTLGFIFSSSLITLCVKLGCLFVIFLLSWDKIVLLYTFLLELFLLHPIGFVL